MSEVASMARPEGCNPGVLAGLDLTLLGAVVCLMALGVIMVASASVHIGSGPGGHWGYLSKHVLAMALGVTGAGVMLRMPVEIWERHSGLLYIAGLVLLAIVMVPGIGRTVNGATRWISVGGFNLQTSEFMKLFIVFYTASYVSRKHAEVATSVMGLLKPLFLVILAAMMLMWQPDYGTTVVLMSIVMGMLFLGGAPLWQFAVLIGMAGTGAVALVLASPYRMERITSFLNPWADPLDTGFQLTQALIAFGRGEWFGVGLGNGVQKQYYLPEAHTDFLMAVIGEELGLMGTLVVIGMFSILVWRAFQIGRIAEARGARFAGFSAYGIGIWLGFQAFINIGVNIGLLPTKGLTLPFLSYGSNSMILCCLAIGMLLRVHIENHTDAECNGGAAWQKA